MKPVLIFLIFIAFTGCVHQQDKTTVMQNSNDTSENNRTVFYKPGFGEMMENIRLYHAKLWYAGQKRNWKLAAFEIHEITETLDDIRKYQKGRKETRYIDMIDLPLENVRISVEQKDSGRFEKSYTELTKSCNECHRITHYEFIKMKIPGNGPFGNQQFGVN